MNEVFVVMKMYNDLHGEPIAVFATNRAARDHVRYLCRYEGYGTHSLDIFAADFLSS